MGRRSFTFDGVLKCSRVSRVLCSVLQQRNYTDLSCSPVTSRLWCRTGDIMTCQSSSRCQNSVFLIFHGFLPSYNLFTRSVITLISIPSCNFLIACRDNVDYGFYISITCLSDVRKFFNFSAVCGLKKRS